MNYSISNLPERTTKPRQKGFTMAMDKGLSVREAEDFMSIASEFVDIVKLGWATSYVTPKVEDKIKVYKNAGVPCYFGGTLFEAFVIRNQFDDYRKVLDKFKLEYAEVSDGSIDLDHDLKCEYITKLKDQVTVLSEVGSKDADKIIPPYMWIDLMQKELAAGATNESVGPTGVNCSERVFNPRFPAASVCSTWTVTAPPAPAKTIAAVYVLLLQIT